MNLLILQPEQLIDALAHLSPRQSNHVLKILRLNQGDSLQVGILNGMIGRACIESVDGENVVIRVKNLDQAPPPPLPLSIILGLPRPQMIKRILQTVATMGVAELHLIQSSRVEKSFWQSPCLHKQAIQDQLLLGLEQGKATQLPEVHFHQRFRPFIEDELESISFGAKKIIAHPGDYPFCTPHTEERKACLAIGPEGGFLQQEVERFIECGFAPIQLGERILKVETAIPVLIGKLF